MGSADKKLRTNKSHVTLNINQLNKLHISSPSFKKSNLSSYLATPAEKSRPKKLKTQPSVSALKIRLNTLKAEEHRHATEAKRECEVRVTVEYGQHTITASFAETTTVEGMKLQLFRQMLAQGADDAELLNLVAFESCEDFDCFVDYWLGEPEQTLEIFTRNSINKLHLKPLFCAVATREIGLTDFTLYQCIGVGGFSRVYLAKCKLNGRLCALKFISKSYIVSNKKHKLLQNEREILAGADSPSIITLYHAFETKNYVVFALECKSLPIQTAPTISCTSTSRSASGWARTRRGRCSGRCWPAWRTCTARRCCTATSSWRTC